MVSNQIIQSTIEGLKDITRVNMLVCDSDARVLASTFQKLPEFESPAAEFAESQADSQSIAGFMFFKIYDEQRCEFVLICEGTGDDIYQIGKITAFQLQGLIVAYKERFDKDNFIKNLLLDNLLLVDIYNRAKKLHIETVARRVVYIIETSAEADVNATEIVSGIYSGTNKDFVTAVDERNTILIKNVEDGYTPEDLDAVAAEVRDVLSQTDAGRRVRVAYGTVVSEIKEVSRTYKEARMALNVGKIFYPDIDIVAYTKLGIGRLIYQLPVPLCRMFLKEIFDGKNPDEFDDEILTTVREFFNNSLNVSETSRKLYIHRNTLVYRIDKLHRATGLDVRQFDDAITFQIALMVGKYMKYMENMEY